MTYIIQYSYQQARKTQGAADLRCQGFHGLSKEKILQLENEYQNTCKYASCKWCEVETHILKSEEPVLGAVCSTECQREIREHYS